MVTKQEIQNAMKIIGPGIISIFIIAALSSIYLNTVLAGKNADSGNSIKAADGQAQTQPNTAPNGAIQQGDVKEVKLQFKDYNYYPNSIYVKKGQKLRLVGDLDSGNKLIGCYTYVRIPSLGIGKRLVQGDNAIEFLADKPGKIPFTCGMGMGTGEIIVQA
ncbi:MAG: cupredoxin domain-containing protein [Candidatus Aenigmarchaeota archaeon]|nr:cupredoxin domain-containing protein [Candidatus Aenigmarchaeota archaeon]